MSRSLALLSIGFMLYAPKLLAQGAPSDPIEVKGQLAETDPIDPVRMKPSKTHEVKLSKGKTYQIDLISADFDSYLRLVNAAGNEVASDDDGGGMLNARIKYTANADETYKIYVTTFAGGAGNYLLQIQGPGAQIGKGAAVAASEPEHAP